MTLLFLPAVRQKDGYLSGLLSQVSWAGLAVGLRGSAGVLAYFSCACSRFSTTLRLLLQLVGLPLRFALTPDFPVMGRLNLLITAHPKHFYSKFLERRKNLPDA